MKPWPPGPSSIIVSLAARLTYAPNYPFESSELLSPVEFNALSNDKGDKDTRPRG